MTLKQKSIFTSLFTSVFIVVVVGGLIYNTIFKEFQHLENQRVERSIKSVDAIFEENLNILNSKIADWSIWDDSYEFMTDHNQEFIDSNLSQETFASYGIDEVLFIDKDGSLTESFLVIKDEASEEAEEDFPEDIYKHFAPGSALLNIDKETGFNKGYIKTEDGLLLFVVRNIVKSDGTGNPNGYLVFAKYFDNNFLTSIKDIAQLNSTMFHWNDPDMPSDFQSAKAVLKKSGQNNLVQPLDDQTISGYLVIKDITDTPQTIVRVDIDRDITIQGTRGIHLFILVLVIAGLLSSGINYWLLSGLVLKKLLLISTDVSNLSKPNTSNRLRVGTSTDEIDNLRNNINKMLDSLNQSESQLSKRERFINLVLDNLDVGIAVNEISTGKAVYMNHAFENIYGWSKNVLTSVDTFFESIYPDVDTRKELKNKILADIKTGDPKQMVWEGLHITTSKGNKKFVNARNIPLSEQDLMVSTVVDVTNTKQSDEDKKRRLEEMEKLNEAMVNRELKMVELKKELEKQRKGEA